MNKIFFLIISSITIFSCNKGINQNNMFKGREVTNNKKGTFDTGVRRNKPMSVQYAEEAQKENKDATNPKKMAKEAEKELYQKKKAMIKHNSQFAKKKKHNVKTTKELPKDNAE